MDSNPETMDMEAEEVTKEKLMNDLKTVAHDAEELLKATAGDLGEKAKVARDRLAVALDNAKLTGRKLQDKALEGARATDQCIRNHPYESIGVAFGLGLVLGLLFKNR
jgi:ElaB/YqjD/DUF883 family membrane-anchored ribosome-binding protein